MAKAGYGADEVNPGVLLVEKIYNYAQVCRGSQVRWAVFTACGMASCQPQLPSLWRAEVPWRPHQGHGVGAAHQGRGAVPGRLRLPGGGERRMGCPCCPC